MNTRIHFTKEALQLCTLQQVEAVCRLAGDDHKIEVMAGGFDLPNGYVTFWQTYHGNDSGRPNIYGGISPEGDAST